MSSGQPSADQHESLARALRLPGLLAVSYILLVPLAMHFLGVGAYHAWWSELWLPLNYHVAIGAIAGLVRWSDGRLGEWLRDRALTALVAGAAFVPFFTAFTAWKQGFWRWGWFVWDPGLARLDAWLHGGRPPFEWLLPLTAMRPVLVGCDWLYLAWGAVMVSTLSSVLWLAPVNLSGGTCCHSS